MKFASFDDRNLPSKKTRDLISGIKSGQMRLDDSWQSRIVTGDISSSRLINKIKV
jgi:hypothetical protein